MGWSHPDLVKLDLGMARSKLFFEKSRYAAGMHSDILKFCCRNWILLNFRCSVLHQAKSFDTARLIQGWTENSCGPNLIDEALDTIACRTDMNN